MSTDMAISLSKKFIRQISQPFDHTQTGISLWALEDIEDKQRKDREEAERVIQNLGPDAPRPPRVMRNGDQDQEMEYDGVEMDYDGMDDEALAIAAEAAGA